MNPFLGNCDSEIIGHVCEFAELIIGRDNDERDDYNHQAFLDFIGDDYSGEDTASYIAENYALEISVWYWAIHGSPYTVGLNEFIDTKMNEGGDPLVIFLKTAYYAAGMPMVPGPNGMLIPDPNFNSDINKAISGNTDYEITDSELIINGHRYKLPSRWDERLAAYEKAQDIW